MDLKSTAKSEKAKTAGDVNGDDNDGGATNT